MADETKTLAWRLIIETQGVEAQTRKAANSLANLEEKTDKVAKGMKGMAVVMKAMVVGKVVMELLKMADAYTELANSLRASTESAGELQAVQLQMMEQAHATSSTVELATASFAKLHDATEGLGLSQQQIIDLSKTLQDIMRLSGMNAEQAQAGIARFGDSLEDGAMNLKEFKAAMRESPELLKAMAAGLGKTVQELRLMAQQGNLTTDMMLEGLAKAAPEVAKKAADMAPTMKAAFASVKSSFGALIGEFNEGAGITENLAREVQAFGGWLKDLAKGAQFVAIAIKVAVGTVTVEMLALFDTAVEGWKRMKIEAAQAVDFLTPGKGMTDQLAKMEKESKARMDAIRANRRETLADIKAQANAQVDAMLGANLNVKPPAAALVVTDEQVKGIKSFADALTGLEDKAVDAMRELAALRIEMTQGKAAADVFRSIMAAGVTQADMLKKYTEVFKELKMTLTDEDRNKLANMIDTQVKAQTELKATADAWGVVTNAMNGAMSETERADKATEELTRALEQLRTSGKLTEGNLRLIDRALANIARGSHQVEDAYNDAMDSMRQQTEDARAEIDLLQVEIGQGVGAANAARAQREADAMARSLQRQTEKDLAAANKGPISQDLTNEINATTKSLAEQRLEATQAADAWAMVSDAMANAMTPTQAAALAVDELNNALKYLQSRGLVLSPEQIALFKKGMNELKDSANMAKQAFKEAGRTLVTGFIDFLADGEFNFKRFAQNMIQQIGRLVIELAVLSAVRSTPWGAKLFAEGGAFSHGRLIPMASGSVVSAPTYFPMAGGNTGLMGEAGPEAVMPLARLSSGKLGVSAEPSNVQVINNTGVQASARIEREANRTRVILEAAELGAQLAEQRITRSMRSGYGATSTALQGTYALRRRG